MQRWRSLYNRLLSYRILRDQQPQKSSYSNHDLLKQAHLDLMSAYNMFNRVIDEDMVDCAIFSISASEKRYNYLIRKIREEYYGRVFKNKRNEVE
ncbi:MAG: DUF2508 family protein [Syntrophomonadaceae bacterium]|jgi:hypothetical protein